MRSNSKTGSTARLKIAQQFRKDLRSAGMSLAHWCRAHQVPYSLTHEVLADRCKGHTGKSHDIAVLLGLKKGVVGKREQPAAKSGRKK